MRNGKTSEINGMTFKDSVARKLANLRSRAADRLLDFKPYIGALEIGDQRLRFFYATAQAVDWYEPLDPHLLAEFAWLQERLNGHREIILDAGAYHGLYAMVLAGAAASGSRIMAVDPVASNVAIMEANFALNGLDIDIVQAAVTDRDGPVSFTRESCGRISSGGPVHVDGRRLPTLLPDATVVKIDIEGAEHAVLSEQLDAMAQVHTWIVEIHPGFDFDPEAVITLFRERGFSLNVLDRQRAAVVAWAESGVWTQRTSLIALRSRTTA